MNENSATTDETAIKHEPSPKWVRVMVNEQFIADSKRTLLAWEKPYYPIYYFPEVDVRLDYLRPTGVTGDGRTIYDMIVGDRVIESSAWAYTQPSLDRRFLKDYVTFKWNKMDHWYEEEEEVFVHARDPYHRVDTLPSSRHIRVEIDGVTVAESRRPFILIETGLPVRYYLPKKDVRMELLSPAKGRTRCPYKGEASYWSAKINGKEFRNIVWGYEDPIPESPKIKGLFSFYNEKVDIYVDGQLESRPRSSGHSASAGLFQSGK